MGEEIKDNIIQLNAMTKLDIPCDKVLRSAIGELKTVVVLGWDKDYNLYHASSKSDLMEILWLLERGKKALLEYPEEEE